MRRGPPYWFPTKRYGWGWGLPRCWQGWVVLAVYTILLVAGAAIFPPNLQPVAYAIHTGLISFVLVFICWLKGEPPRWRWGD